MRGLALETRFLLEQEREVRVAERRADGSYLLEIQLGRVQGSVQLPLAKPVAFDSRGAEPELEGPAVGFILAQTITDGRTIEAVLAPTGVVQSIEGYADIVRGTDLEEELGAVGIRFDDETYLKDVQRLLAILPRRDPTTTPRWEREHEFLILGHAIRVRPRFALVAEEGDRLEWTFTTEPAEAEGGAPDSERRERSSEPYTLRWVADGLEIDEAAYRGAEVVSRRDGLPLERRFSLALDMQVEDPNLAEPLPVQYREEFTVARIAAQDDGAGR